MRLVATTTIFIPGVLSFTGIKNRDDCLSGDFVLLCRVRLECIVGGSISGSLLIPIANSNKEQRYELESIILR